MCGLTAADKADAISREDRTPVIVAMSVLVTLILMIITITMITRSPVRDMAGWEETVAVAALLPGTEIRDGVCDGRSIEQSFEQAVVRQYQEVSAESSRTGSSYTSFPAIHDVLGDVEAGCSGFLVYGKTKNPLSARIINQAGIAVGTEMNSEVLAVTDSEYLTLSRSSLTSRGFTTTEKRNALARTSWNIPAGDGQSFPRRPDSTMTSWINLLDDRSRLASVTGLTQSQVTYLLRNAEFLSTNKELIHD